MMPGCGPAEICSRCLGELRLRDLLGGQLESPGSPD
jgi:hypothetical protein